MVIVDSSVWIDHFYKPVPELITLLENNKVLMHPFVLGELACGNLSNREKKLFRFKLLPRAQTADTETVLDLIESKKLYGKGVGWIDCNLIATAIIEQATLLSFDKRLAQEAKRLSLNFCV